MWMQFTCERCDEASNVKPQTSKGTSNTNSQENFDVELLKFQSFSSLGRRIDEWIRVDTEEEHSQDTAIESYADGV